MIAKNPSEGWVGCTICGERVTQSRDQARDELGTLALLQAMRLDHKACEQYSFDPERARIERIYRIGMRGELDLLTRAPNDEQSGGSI